MVLMVRGRVPLADRLVELRGPTEEPNRGGHGGGVPVDRVAGGMAPLRGRAIKGHRLLSPPPGSLLASAFVTFSVPPLDCHFRKHPLNMIVNLV